jgi:hypothetical protein
MTMVQPNPFSRAAAGRKAESIETMQVGMGHKSGSGRLAGR